jgi:very-short-patch-repair endonuclease
MAKSLARLKLSRRLRREMTPPEVLLWVRLRPLRAQGVRFRRQHPVGPYVLDFYCAESRLAVEVDGFAHLTEDRPLRDAKRDGWLEAQGVRVMRVAAAEVMADPDGIAQGVYLAARR